MAVAKEMFIYELPYSVRTQLCLILDFNDKWEELGKMNTLFVMLYSLGLIYLIKYVLA